MKGTGESKSYQYSHAADGYGNRYKRTYEKGYYYYQWIYLEKPLLQKIFRDLKSDGAESFLDFACGTGRILKLGQDYFEETTGVDVAETMLDVARKNCTQSHILNTDITVRPMAERYDIISAFRFFLNAEAELRHRVLHSLHDLLNPQGVLVTNIHVNSRSLLGLFYQARNRFSALTANTEGYPEFRALLDQHGFLIEKVYWYGFLPRTGWYFEWVPKYFMIPLESVYRMIPFLKEYSQAFICVCRRVS